MLTQEEKDRVIEYLGEKRARHILKRVAEVNVIGLMDPKPIAGRCAIDGTFSEDGICEHGHLTDLEERSVA